MKSIAEYKAIVDGAVAQVTKLSVEVAEKDLKIASLEVTAQMITPLRNELTNLRRISNEHKRLEAERERLLAELSQVKKRNDEVVDDLRTQLSDTTNRLTAEREAIAELGNKYRAEIGGMKEEYKDKMTELRRENGNLKSQLTKYKNKTAASKEH